MSSAYPAAVQQLIQVFTAAYPTDATGTPVMVWYGVELGVYSAPTTIEINGYTGDQEPAELGISYRREETGSIHCKITVYAGNGADSVDHVNRMVDCWNVWDALEVAVANNPTLNGTVRFAELGAMDDTPTTTGQGMAMGQLVFDVRYSARVQSLS